MIILSFIVILITKSKLKTELPVKTATGLRTLNLVVLVLMIATTLYSVFTMSASFMTTLALGSTYTEDDKLAVILAAMVGIILGTLVLTLLLSIWQIKILKRLKLKIGEQAVVPEAEDARANDTAVQDNKRKIAFYIAAATSPVLFIIRMMAQTSEHVSAGNNGAWRSYDRVFVPGNVKAIMFVLLAAAIGISAYLRKESKSKDYSKASVTTVLSVVNALLGLLIIFAEF